MRISSIIFLFSFYINAIFSQGNSIGIKIAPSLSLFNNKVLNTETSSVNLTYMIGFQFQKKLSNHISLIGELGYDVRKHTENILINSASNPIGYNEELSTVFNYIDIPVLLRYNIAKNPSVFGNLGFSNSFKLSAYQRSESIPKNNTIGQYVNAYNIGLLAGIGLSQNLFKKLSLSFETRFRLGLSDHLSVNNNVKTTGNILYVIGGLNYNFLNL